METDAKRTPGKWRPCKFREVGNKWNVHWWSDNYIQIGLGNRPPLAHVLNIPATGTSGRECVAKIIRICNAYASIVAACQEFAHIWSGDRPPVDPQAKAEFMALIDAAIEEAPDDNA